MKPSEQFKQILENNSYGIFFAPTSDALAVDVLKEYLLGEEWISADPISYEQINTGIVHGILMKHSRKYRKEWKKLMKKVRKQHFDME